MLSINEIILKSCYRWLLPTSLLFICVLAGIDLVADMYAGTDFVHSIAELLVFVIAFATGFSLVFHLLQEAKQTRMLLTEMQQKIEHHKQDAEDWQNEARSLLQGIGVHINKQFDRWRLSQSEKEIALFLLKGLSHKEIAFIRNVSQATARQQAHAVYQKAGVAGRNELSAFFLEELALPTTSK